VVDGTRVHQQVVLSIHSPVDDVAASVVGGLLHTLNETEPVQDVQHFAGKGVSGDVVVDVQVPHDDGLATQEVAKVEEVRELCKEGRVEVHAVDIDDDDDGSDEDSNGNMVYDDGILNLFY